MSKFEREAPGFPQKGREVIMSDEIWSVAVASQIVCHENKIPNPRIKLFNLVDEVGKKKTSDGRILKNAFDRYIVEEGDFPDFQTLVEDALDLKEKLKRVKLTPEQSGAVINIYLGKKAEEIKNNVTLRQAQ